MAAYKDSTNRLLKEYCSEHGLDMTISLGRAMLEAKKSSRDKSFYTDVNGEVCETVLELIIDQYILDNCLKEEGWFYKKGLIIKEPKQVNTYYTELDLTVFSPQKIFIFECKSYSGAKTITDTCTIRRKNGNDCDVFRQNYKHANALANQFSPFRTNKASEEAPYQLVLFNFSCGSVNDVRPALRQVMMPCLDETNIVNIFDVYRNHPIIWRMDKVRQAADIIDKHSDENRSKHLSYVKSLHGKKGR